MFKSKSQDDLFDSEASFELIYHTYLLDIDFNSILLKYILMVEKSFKTKLAYYVADKHGENHHIYLKEHLYSNRNRKRFSILNKITKMIVDCRKHTPTHYYLNTKGYIPPWILANDMMFGLAHQWYSILSEDLKDKISEDMFSQKYAEFPLEYKKDFLTNSLDLLREFRNAAAHGSRTFNFKHHNKKLNRNIYQFNQDGIVSKDEYVKLNRGQNDVFSILVIITVFMNETISLKRFFNELELFDEYLKKQIILNKTGHQVFKLPVDFVDRLKKLK